MENDSNGLTTVRPNGMFTMMFVALDREPL